MRSDRTGAANGRPDSLLPFIGSLQLADSLFPSGLYTLSHGLEAYAELGLLTAETLPEIISDLLLYSFGKSDVIALACARRASDDFDLALVEQADLRLTAVKLTRETRQASIRTGRQLLSLAVEVFGSRMISDYDSMVRAQRLPGNHAIVLGLVKGELGIPSIEAIAGELYSFVTSCVGAALRMSLIDHRQTQATINRLKPLIANVARGAADRDVDQIAGSAPFAEIMSMQHETADVRLFVS